MKNVREYNTTNEKITHDEEYSINGSGLFNWNSDLSNEEKLVILTWFNKLSTKDKEYVMILREEAQADESDSYAGEGF